jgi:hypothetical protein
MRKFFLVLGLFLLVSAHAAEGRLSLYVAKETGNKAVELGRIKVSSNAKTEAESKSAGVTIVLNHIKALKISEKHGDELFFDCLLTSNHRKPKHFQVPPEPYHWPTKALKQAVKVPLWTGNIANNESKIFSFSLLEQDAPPWNVNDLIGAFKVKIDNQQGQLNYTFYQAKTKSSGALGEESVQKQFILEGSGGRYQVGLGFKRN